MKPEELMSYRHQTKDYWSGIRKYICDHITQFKKATPDMTDDAIRKLINSRFNSTSSGEGVAAKERDNFRKCTKGLCDGTHPVAVRLNQYRLIFALKLESPDGDEVVNEANNFLLNYLLEPELSARNLLDFIIIASLKKGLSWTEAYTLYDKYESYGKKSVTAPDNLEEGYTKRLFEITCLFEDKEDLADFLAVPDNLKYFSITNNTRYLALFDSFVVIKKANSIRLIEDINRYDDDGNLMISFKKMTSLYNTIFGLKNMDDSKEHNDENPLTKEELSVLSVLYPSVFMTYDTFRTLVRRTRSEEISHGVMLLKLIEEMDPNPASDQYVDFSNPEEFRYCAMLFFLMVGLPDISEKDVFDKLVMDTYYEVLRENPKEGSIAIKSKFIRRLRLHCKIIANT